jgi:hypothetical protein
MKASGYQADKWGVLFFGNYFLFEYLCLLFFMLSKAFPNRGRMKHFAMEYFGRKIRYVLAF